MHYLALRLHGRRRRTLHSQGFPGGMKNLIYAHLAGHVAEDRACSGAQTGLSPSYNCYQPRISAAGPSRRNPLSSTSSHKAILKRQKSTFLFFWSLNYTGNANETSLTQTETTWTVLTLLMLTWCLNCMIFRPLNLAAAIRLAEGSMYSNKIQ